MKVVKLIIIIFFLTPTLYTFSNFRKETFAKKVSFFHFQNQNDSITKEFNQLKNNFNKKEYYLALDKSLEFIKKYADSPQNIEQDKYVYEVYYLIGEIYRKTNSQENSLVYYKKAFKLLQNNQKFKDNLSSVRFSDEKSSNLFLKIGANYMNLGKVDSAKLFYDKILNLSSINNSVLSSKASASSNLSGIYMQDTLYDLAREYALNAAQIHSKLNNKISESVALGNLASIYLSQDNFTKAKETYKQALDLIKLQKSDRALRVRENLYFNLAYNLYKLKDHEAYTYQELSYNIKDTLRDKEIRGMIEELGLKYNFESKKEIFEKEAENIRLKQQRRFLFIGLVALIIIISLLYRVKLNRLKLQKTEFIKDQELSKIKSESQSRILNATIDGKESERKEIAETLHDSVSALLSSANLHLQATRKQFEGKTPVEIDKTQEIITEATQKIRDLSHNLVSSVLLKFGLDFAVTEIAEKYSNTELRVTTNIKNVARYHQKFEIKVYNIIQEFMNNVFKHSKANNANIHLIEKNKKLVLTITDDGIGFDKTKINLKDGLGINQIDARIQMMQGKFHIDSSAHSGTTIFVEIPIVEKEAKTLAFPIQ